MNRARKLVPKLQGDLVAGAAHRLNIDHPCLLNSRILQILNH